MFILENSELRERKSMGLANQLNLKACTLLHKCKQLSGNVLDDIRALLIYLARSSYTLAMNSASSMSKMLRLRREPALTTRLPNFLIGAWPKYIAHYSSLSRTLFRGRIESVLSTDHEDQLHASLALGNQNKPMPFLRQLPADLSTTLKGKVGEG